MILPVFPLWFGTNSLEGYSQEMNRAPQQQNYKQQASHDNI